MAHSPTAAFWGPVPTARLWAEGVGTMTLPGAAGLGVRPPARPRGPAQQALSTGDYYGLHCDRVRGGPTPVPQNATLEMRSRRGGVPRVHGDKTAGLPRRARGGGRPWRGSGVSAAQQAEGRGGPSGSFPSTRDSEPPEGGTC